MTDVNFGHGISNFTTEDFPAFIRVGNVIICLHLATMTDYFTAKNIDVKFITSKTYIS